MNVLRAAARDTLGCMRRPASLFASVLTLASAACGGGGRGAPAGEPVISSTVKGAYDTAPFTIKFGFVTLRPAGNYIIALGSETLDCASLDAPAPPHGDSASLSLASVDVGVYSGIQVQLFHNIGAFTSVASNTGAIGITLSSPTSVGGTVAYTDTISGKSYALNGSFEVVRCP
jgi:hypothetical protein